MELTRDQVLHLASLARLELTPDEVERYRKQLAEVLAYVAQLQELGSDTTLPPRGTSVLRSDAVQSFAEPARLVATAPEHDDSFVVVPPVFDERR